MERVFKPGEVEERFIRSRGKGGQSVNKVETGVQLKHLPTGIVIKCDKFRYQKRNKDEAYRLLEEKLEQKEKKRIADELARKEKKRRQNRKRTRASKEKMLSDKKQQSEKKSLRRRPEV